MRRLALILPALLAFTVAGTTDGRAQDQEDENLNVWASVGWSHLALPEFAFTLRHENRNTAGGFDPLQFAGRQTDHDGDVNGNRLDFGFSGIPLRAGQDYPVTFGVKGFYFSAEANARTGCDETASPKSQPGGITCTFVPLTQSTDDPTDYEIGAAELHSGTVDRDVLNWGAAAETLLGGQPSGGLAMKLGGAYRTIRQDIGYSVFGEDGFANPASGEVNYDETLDTDYWGGYVGVVGSTPLGHGFKLSLDGEMGLYAASTDYAGSYAYGVTRENASSLELSDNSAAFIGSLKLELSKRIGAVNLSAFALGEYYSYAPKMLYKSTDLNDGGGAQGDAAQTQIDDDDAWSFTAGGRLSINLN